MWLHDVCCTDEQNSITGQFKYVIFDTAEEALEFTRQNPKHRVYNHRRWDPTFFENARIDDRRK